ncbi:hypothetical protein BG006_004866, partial [Podila minutissima]
MLDNRNSHPSLHHPTHPPEPGSGSSPSPTSPKGLQGTYADIAGKKANVKWQLTHKTVHDAGGESIYATHFPPVTNPHPNTVTYTGLPRNINPSDFHNACWDTVAPLSGFKARLEDNGTKSFFIGYDLLKTDFETKAELNHYVLKTPVNFAGNQYLPQIPIPENVNITKIYVSEVALPTSHYVKYHFDAHVFLAPLKGQQEIVFPDTSKDNIYEVPHWGHKIRTTWGSDAPCTY